MDRRYLVHLLQLLGPPLSAWAVYEYFSVVGILVALVTFFLMRCIGATITYHRVLCHQTHTMRPAVEFICTALGFYGSQTAPVSFCAAHASHHKYVDTDRDPHPPVLIGWRAAFPLLWNGDGPTDGLDLRTIVRIRRNPIANFFDKHYWKLVGLPLLLLWVSPQLFLFAYLLPMTLSFMSLSLSTFNHGSGGPKNMGKFFGICTGGEHMHEWHHAHPHDTTGEGWLNSIICAIAIPNKDVKTR